MKSGDRVIVSDRFPSKKLQINNLAVGDAGTVRTIFHYSMTQGIALVDWDKGFRTTANETDLDKE